MGQVRPPRITRFAALSFLCVAVLALIMGSALSALLTRAVSDWEWENTAALTRRQLELEGLDALFVAPQNRDTRARWQRELTRLFAGLPEIVRIKVWGPDGAILWSDDAGLIGRRFADNKDFQASRAGKVSVNIKELTKAEHGNDRGRFAVLAEVYVPIFSKDNRNEVIGVLEVYKTPARLFATIRRGRTVVWTISLLGGFALYLVLLPLVRQVYGRQVYAEALQAHTDRLEREVADRTRALLDETTERKRVEEQLRQAQKMEAIGRLAGGVAHDFNNLLGVILGHSDLLLNRLEPGSPLQRHVDLILKTSARAATLTHQLLAFSRKQILAPRVLDLNAVVAGMERMLRRLIGEDIDLVIAPGTGLDRIMADPGQMEQVILNLAANARDAMPRGGRLTLETANVELDEAYTRQHPGASAGRHVLLALSDTGAGMDPETRERLFEPFFTTKESGKGTGLGLATVYGIVKQSGGNIWVYSEPGHGTAFKIYLPRAEAPAEAPAAEPPPAPAPRGTETILLVEDENDLRDLAGDVLTSHGYRVLSAASPSQALGLLDGHAGPIHLLLTDVVMPGMSGRDLAQLLGRRYADLRVLYMSGYTDEAIVQHGVLAPGTHFLQKPFTPDTLTRQARQVLEMAPTSPETPAPALAGPSR